MVAACSEAFFAAERDVASIQQVSEEFPAGRRLKALDPQIFGDNIHSSTGGHGASYAGQA